MIGRLTENIQGFVELGGPVVAILLVLSVFAMALIILKLVQFTRESVGNPGRANRALQAWFQRDYVGARRMLDNNRSPLGAALATAMQLTAAGNASKEMIEDEIGRIAVSRLHDLQRGFRALDAIVQTAPLLGLFGTVLGMIEAFQQLQAAGNAVDPSALAGGIWVALLTTAAGLAIAMPVSLVLTWFETRLENERVAIETMTSAVLSRQALSGAQPVAKPELGGGATVGERGHAH